MKSPAAPLSVVCVFGKPCPINEHTFNQTVSHLSVWLGGKLVLPARRVRRCSKCGAIDTFSEVK